jgi:hypothetical protein
MFRNCFTSYNYHQNYIRHPHNTFDASTRPHNTLDASDASTDNKINTGINGKYY